MWPTQGASGQQDDRGRLGNHHGRSKGKDVGSVGPTTPYIQLWVYTPVVRSMVPKASSTSGLLSSPRVYRVVPAKPREMAPNEAGVIATPVVTVPSVPIVTRLDRLPVRE